LGGKKGRKKAPLASTSPLGFGGLVAAVEHQSNNSFLLLLGTPAVLLSVVLIRDVFLVLIIYTYPSMRNTLPRLR